MSKQKTKSTVKKKGGRGPTISKKRFEEMIPKSFGVVKNMCSLLNVTRQSVHQFLNREGNEELKKMFDEARYEIVDIAENSIFKIAAKSKNEKNRLNASKFIVETLGKDRGYIKSQHQDLTTDGEKLQPAVLHLPANPRDTEALKKVKNESN